MMTERDLRNEGIKVKPLILKPSQIEENLFVRDEIDLDHCRYLSELIKAADEGKGEKLPFILVIAKYRRLRDGTIDFFVPVEKYVVIYGRHRYYAEINILFKEEIKVLCVTEGVFTETQLISVAFRENIGGSKPPTEPDIRHTIKLLMEAGASKREIPTLLNLPLPMVGKYISDIESDISNRKLQQGRRLVIEQEVTVKKAAEQVGIDSEKLRRYMHDSKITEEHARGDAVVRKLGTAFQTHARTVAGLLRSLKEKFDEGTVDAECVRGALTSISRYRKRSEATFEDWKKRFEAKLNGS